MKQRLSKQKRQEQIINSTIKLISRKGIDSFTIRKLAKDVGVSEGAIFRHFSSKNSILKKSVEKIQKMIMTDFPPDEKDPLVRLGSFFKQRLKFARSNQEIMTLLQSEQLKMASGEEAALILENTRKKSMDFVWDCLEEARAKNILQETTRTSSVFILILSSIFSLASFHDSFIENYQVDIDVFWNDIEKLFRKTEAI
ncbi:MAG: TetR/AcrR family transcriptional regulator [Deltaproteobacteria bacterium]|jgi:AcrR family transcriptional regulator|nr:TetR/AcrR family transcriptional regulator [Deltaproteobacteria bacterium]